MRDRFLLQMVLPLMMVIFLVTIGFLLNWPVKALVLISYGGTFVVLVGNFAWIVLVNSNERWPGTPVRTRITRVLTFYRD